MRRICMIVALLTLVFACVLAIPAQVQAAEEPEIIDSGTCGDNLTWTLDDEGTLTISGTGDMYNYYWPEAEYGYAYGYYYCPWTYDEMSNGMGEDWYISTVVIANGVTSIGSFAFKDCRAIEIVYIPDTVTSVGEAAFDCSGWNEDDFFDPEFENPGCIWHVMYEGTEQEWNAILWDVENIDVSYADVIHYNCNGTEIVDRETKVCSICDCTHSVCETVVENATDVTCVQDGYYEEVVYCTECGSVISRTRHTVEATGHAWDNGICTECGYDCFHPTSETVAENIKDGTCAEAGSYDEVEYCSVCSCELLRTKITVEVGHTWDNGICTVCDYACTHPDRDKVGEVTIPPTCVEDGVLIFITRCTECSSELDREEETLYTLGHKWDTWGEGVCTECGYACIHEFCRVYEENIIPPTCVEGGSYYEVVHCDFCNSDRSRTYHTVEATGHAWDNGICTECDYVCTHSAGEPVVENATDVTCVEDGYYEEVGYCTECGSEIFRTSHIVEATGHTWDNGICTVCDYVCTHSWDAGVYSPATETENGYTTYACSDCGVTKRIDDVIPPEIDTDEMEEPEGDSVMEEEKEEILDRIEQAGDEIKIVVGFEDQKNKDKINNLKDKNPDLKDEIPKLHIAAKKMFITGDKATRIVYDVTPMFGDQKLELGAEITFRLPVDAYTDVLYAYVFHEGECLGKYEIHGSAENGKYIVVTAKEFSLYTVDTSGHEWNVSTTEPTYTAMGQRVTACALCGEVYETVSIPAKFYGTSVNLGNTLDMYFGFYTGLVDANGTVKFVREFADGTTETTEKPITAFNKNNSVYDITYTGLAAKEMCDTIHIYVYNGDGVLVGEHSDSIRSYVLRQLREKEYGAEFRTLCIDLLNYGAAAQTAFGYAADDLANKDLTAEELAEGTQTVAEYTNKQTITGTAESYYYGTAYILEEKISMAMAVKAEYFGEGCYALISYTDHTGTEKTDVRLDGVLNNSVYEFIFNEMVVADGRCLLTMEFYKADGTLIVTVQDSMESYTARNAAVYPLAEKMLAFSDSAYNYLH